MKFYNKQKNKLFTTNYKRGFTLIETMIAVFILAIAITSTLGIISTSLYSSRYANNEITANYLAQEISDYIRNDRDSIAFQQISDIGGGWNSFLNRYGYATLSNCFSASGCEIEPANTSVNINACSGSTSGWGTIGCKILNYDESASNKDFYTYSLNGKPSKFKRKVSMSINPTINNPNELDITVSVEWQNGTIVRSKTLRTSLLNWQTP